jgi:hypothetical protein
MCMTSWMGPKEVGRSVFGKFRRVILVAEGSFVFTYMEAKSLPIWPTYSFPQSGHVSL